MAPQQVIDYIKSQINRGVDKAAIRKALLDIGWPEATVNEAFGATASPLPAAQPSASLPTQTKPLTQAQQPIQGQNTAMQGQAPTNAPREVYPPRDYQAPAQVQPSIASPSFQSLSVVAMPQKSVWPGIFAILGIMLLVGISIGAGFFYHRYLSKQKEAEPVLIENQANKVSEPQEQKETSQTSEPAAQTQAEESAPSSTLPAEPVPSLNEQNIPANAPATSQPSEPAASGDRNMNEEFKALSAYEKNKNTGVFLSAGEEKDIKTRDDLITLGFFLQLYYSRNNSYPRNLADLATLGVYSRLAPIDPAPFAYAAQGSADYKMCVNYETRGYLCFMSDPAFKKEASIYMNNLR